MAGSPVKRVIGTLLFTVAVVVTLGFFAVLYLRSQQIDVLDAETWSLAMVSTIVLLAVAILLFVLVVVRGLDRRAQKRAEAEAYYIPEEDRLRLRREKEGLFDEIFQGTPGPAPSPPDVKVYHLPAVPIASQAWGEMTPARLGATYPFYFPRSVESGVYVNDYIDVDRKGNRIKLRTLLAGTEDFPEIGTVPDEPEAPEAEERPAHEGGEEQEAEEQEASKEWPAEPEGRPRPTRPVRRTHEEPPGDAFLRELEERRRAMEKERPVLQVQDEVHYDFPGDVQNVEDIEGIGPVYAERLRQAGVRTTARLCYEDPMELSTKIDCPTRNVRRWQATAELLKVPGIGPQYAEALARAGVEGVDALKRMSASDIVEQVNTYLAGLEAGSTQRLSEKRVQGWQQKAKGMRRVRMKVPAE